MRRFVVVILIALFAVACGSDGSASSTAEGKKYVDAMMKSYGSSAAKKAINESQARCISVATIDAAGVDGLKKAGITPEGLSHGSSFNTVGKKLPKNAIGKVATAIVNAKCVNVGEVLLKSGAEQSAAFAAIPKTKVRCIFLTLAAPAAAQQAFADSLLGLSRGDTEFTASFRNEARTKKVLKQCKVDEKLLR